MPYQKFCDKVEKLIYDNLSSKKNDIINNVLNYGFNLFIIQIIKTGIKEQFKSFEDSVLNEILLKCSKD